MYAGSGPGRVGKRNLYPPWYGGCGPRLGLAYQLKPSTVLRLSSSRSFGPVKNTGGSMHWQGFVGSYSHFTTDLSITPAFLWDDGFPPWIPPPDLRPDLQNGQYASFWQASDSGRLPEFYNFNFNIQHQLPGTMVAEVGYNAVMGRHLTTGLVNVNQVNPAIFEDLVSRFGIQGAISLMAQNINSTAARDAGIPFP